LSFSSCPVFAQEIANLFLEKFDKDDNLEIISIGKKMFQMMENASSNTDFNEAIKGLEKIVVISSKDSVFNNEYYDSAYEILTGKRKDGFESLLSTKEEKGELIVMAKESKGIIRELVLLQGDKIKYFSLISLCGNIDLKTLAKYSEKINLSGLKSLDVINKKNDQ
jgi:hypothetical protein